MERQWGRVLGEKGTGEKGTGKRGQIYFPANRNKSVPFVVALLSLLSLLVPLFRRCKSALFVCYIE
jgi:hypothetical protein